MKLSILVAGLVLSTVVSAQPNQITSRVFGTVISATPVTTSVQVQQPCTQFRNMTEPSAVNAKSIIGAVVGGLIGSQIGQGQGRDAAIAAGAAAGALYGNDSNRTESQQIQQICPVVTEQRIIGYNIVADYQGVQVTGQTVQSVAVGSKVMINVVSTFRMEN